MSASLAGQFLHHLGRPLRAEELLPAQLEEELERQLAECRERLFELEVETSAFVEGMALRLGPLVTLQTLRELHGSDLYLARACAAGQASAVQCFERLCMPAVAQAVSRVDSARGSVDDVLQSLRERLFLGPAPSVRTYSGRGPLVGWACVSGVRAALAFRSGGTPDEAPEDAALGAVATEDSPELAYLKVRHRSAFREAFHEALQELEPQERNVLRLNALDGLSIDEIGAVYGVHRATIARWLLKSRARLRERTRSLLGARLDLQGDDVDSLVRLMDSDLSLRRVLGPQ